MPKTSDYNKSLSIFNWESALFITSSPCQAFLQCKMLLNSSMGNEIPLIKHRVKLWWTHRVKMGWEKDETHSELPSAICLVAWVKAAFMATHSICFGEDNDVPVVHLGDALRFNLPYGKVKAIKLGNILCCNYYNFTLLLTQIGRYYSSVHL